MLQSMKSSHELQSCLFVRRFATLRTRGIYDPLDDRCCPSVSHVRNTPPGNSLSQGPLMCVRSPPNHIIHQLHTLRQISQLYPRFSSEAGSKEGGSGDGHTGKELCRTLAIPRAGLDRWATVIRFRRCTLVWLQLWLQLCYCLDSCMVLQVRHFRLTKDKVRHRVNSTPHHIGLL